MHGDAPTRLCATLLHAGTAPRRTFLRNLSDSSHVDPNLSALSVRHSLVWLSKAGFSTMALTNKKRWFLTWNGLSVLRGQRGLAGPCKTLCKAPMRVRFPRSEALLLVT